jgi:alpha-glucosidase
MANGATSKSLGNLISSTSTESGLTGETTCGKFQLTVYSDSIVRICATQGAFETFSYAVISEPDKKVAFSTIHADDHLIFELPQYKIRISKNPVRFTFLTADYRIINEEDDFGISWIGEQVSAYKKLQEGERFIGLGEKTGPLDRRGSGYQNWNTDNFGFSTIADPLYCSTPFYIGVHHRLVYGIFMDNSHKTFFNFGASNDRFASFSADAGDMNYYFIFGESVSDIVKRYTHLTGRMEMPPRWSIGYQQCRYSYYPDKEVIGVAKTFREKDIPADVIVLDIHYMEDYKIFTWSKKNFGDPLRLIKELRALGFQVVVICDPGIKIESGYAAYEEGVSRDIFLKYPNGTRYSGQVWPGWCHFPDFTNPHAREWWKEQFKVYTDMDISGFWNDMNEIATWGNMVPENIEFDFEGNKGTMRSGRNIYGFQMARSTYDGTKALLKGKRPFNLTRSGFSGVQRYAAVWTGDNVSYDEHMILGVRMISNMGLTGIAFAGYDVGGFVGEANAKLFARWITIGAFAPLYRGHTMLNSRDSEPWSYGEEVEQIARNYIRFRYQLMPYIYSLFYEACQTGLPIQRSLALNDAHDPKIYDRRYYNQYLFGPYILVCPANSTQDLLRIYLPEGDWYSLYDGLQYHGNTEIVVDCPLSKLPVFIKEGAIIPMQPALSNTATHSESLSLHVYFGKADSSFTYYTDDGETFEYQQGVFHMRGIQFQPQQKKLTLEESEGNYLSSSKKLKIIFHSFPDLGGSVSVNGLSHQVHSETLHFFSPLERFDPFYEPAYEQAETVRIIELDYSNDAIVIRW